MLNREKTIPEDNQIKKISNFSFSPYPLLPLPLCCRHGFKNSHKLPNSSIVKTASLGRLSNPCFL